MTKKRARTLAWERACEWIMVDVDSNDIFDEGDSSWTMEDEEAVRVAIREEVIPVIKVLAEGTRSKKSDG